MSVHFFPFPLAYSDCPYSGQLKVREGEQKKMGAVGEGAGGGGSGWQESADGGGEKRKRCNNGAQAMCAAYNTVVQNRKLGIPASHNLALRRSRHHHPVLVGIANSLYAVCVCV